MSVLEVQDLGVQIAGRPILRDISLKVHQGEVVALLGENGSGKSTLVRAVLGLQTHSRGSITVFGEPLERFRGWGRVGYVPQRSTATGGVPATVWEVVASGRLSHRRLLMPLGKGDRAAISDALEAVGLAERARDTLTHLSGGQQQRALIARALAGDPELLILDEPNAGVDVGSQQALADSLTALVSGGATVLIVLHELGPLAPLITRTVVLRDGRTAYDGPPEASHHDHGHHHTVRPEPPAPHVRAPFDADGVR